MHQVIDESIRCGISTVFAARSKEEEIELGGYKIPKNTPVVQALGVVMADEKWWSAPQEHPYAFPPFGFAGKRKCPGYKFVYIKATVFLTSVLRRFKVLPHGDQQLTHEQGFSTHPVEELWVKLVKRQV
ncbi:cytochrome p450 20a1 [Plakobranchus ocellatus]|uniref:Cytochrome p450 20a1 n=1 Tax=Plakobranchus ocellatus TaxID=259542 RepID=A0AAV4B5W7_9GAST|nr:cytochrome p450 20a1 [Plakobranchus ocellatus]